MIDLSKLSMAELRDLQTQIAEQIKTRQKDEIAKVQKQILELARSVGMTPAEILKIKDKGGETKKPVAARYRHPEQPELEWTGRGRQPRWIAEYLEKSGKKIDSLLIQ